MYPVQPFGLCALPCDNTGVLKSLAIAKFVGVLARLDILGGAIRKLVHVHLLPIYLDLVLEVIEIALFGKLCDGLPYSIPIEVGGKRLCIGVALASLIDELHIHFGRDLHAVVLGCSIFDHFANALEPRGQAALIKGRHIGLIVVLMLTGVNGLAFLCDRLYAL